MTIPPWNARAQRPQPSGDGVEAAAQGQAAGRAAIARAYARGRGLSRAKRHCARWKNPGLFRRRAVPNRHRRALRRRRPGLYGADRKVIRSRSAVSASSEGDGNASRLRLGRVAQRESIRFTREGSQVQSLSRPPAAWRTNPCEAGPEAGDLPLSRPDRAQVLHGFKQLVERSMTPSGPARDGDVRVAEADRHDRNAGGVRGRDVGARESPTMTARRGVAAGLARWSA